MGGLQGGGGLTRTTQQANHASHLSKWGLLGWALRVCVWGGNLELGRLGAVGFELGLEEK